MTPDERKVYYLNRKLSDPDRFKGYALRRHHGITITQFRELEVKQKGLCALCGNPPSVGRFLHVDHCHETRRIRGLLCLHCNTALGNFNDDPALLRKAARYLEDRP